MSSGENLPQTPDEPVHALGHIRLAQRAVGDAQIAAGTQSKGMAGDDGDLVFPHLAGDHRHGVELGLQPRQQIKGTFGRRHLHLGAEGVEPL